MFIKCMYKLHCVLYVNDPWGIIWNWKILQGVQTIHEPILLLNAVALWRHRGTRPLTNITSVTMWTNPICFRVEFISEIIITINGVFVLCWGNKHTLTHRSALSSPYWVDTQNPLRSSRLMYGSFGYLSLYFFKNPPSKSARTPSMSSKMRSLVLGHFPAQFLRRDTAAPRWCSSSSSRAVLLRSSSAIVSGL